MEYPERSSLLDILTVLRRGFLPALFVAAIVGGLVYTLIGLRDARYEASATLIASLGATNGNTLENSLVTSPPVDVSVYRAALESPPVLNAALERIGVEEPGERERERLAERIDLEVVTTDVSSLLTLRLEGSDALEVANTVNGVANALLAWDQQRAVQNLERIMTSLTAQLEAVDEEIRRLQLGEGGGAFQLDTFLTRRSDLASRFNTAQALATSAVGRLEVLSYALPADEPLSQRRSLLTVAAALLAMFVVYGIVFLNRSLANRMHGAEEFSETSGLPVLAEFARPRRRGEAISPEAANYLRTNLMFEFGDRDPDCRLLLVTSIDNDVASSAAAIGVAESFARAGERTLLVDANLRNPTSTLHYDVGPETAPSLENYLASRELQLQPISVAIEGNHRLHFVPSFRALSGASEQLYSALRTRLETWRESYNVIVVASAPVLAYADATVIATQSTGVLLVDDLSKINRRQARSAVTQLRRVGVHTIGAALANPEFSGSVPGAVPTRNSVGRHTETAPSPSVVGAHRPRRRNE